MSIHLMARRLIVASANEFNFEFSSVAAYGHLFPGEEAEAVGRMRAMLVDGAPEALRATGTDSATAASSESAQHLAQLLERETRRADATACDKWTNPASPKESPEPLQTGYLLPVPKRLLLLA